MMFCAYWSFWKAIVIRHLQDNDYEKDLQDAIIAP